ncbi:MAG: hypothetical protein H6661_13560 [Ardenticatenaceae bacterium]|nr:hypothetical protein [Ardenticatenaceae bacterium]
MHAETQRKGQHLTGVVAVFWHRLSASLLNQKQAASDAGGAVPLTLTFPSTPAPVGVVLPRATKKM